MARLDSLPDPEVIRQFRGVIDFYLWRGVPVARAWPRPPAHQPEAVRQAAAIFRDYSQRVNNTYAPLRDYAAKLGMPYGWTWKDVLTRAAYGNLQYPKALHLQVQPAVCVHMEWLTPIPGQHTLRLHWDTPVHMGGGFWDRGAPVTPRYITERGIPRQLGITMPFDANINFNAFPDVLSTTTDRPATNTLWQQFPGIIIYYGQDPIFPGANLTGALPAFTLQDIGFTL